MSAIKTDIRAATRPIHAVGAAACIAVVGAAATLFLLPTVKARQQSRADLLRLDAVSTELDTIARSTRSLENQVEGLGASVRERAVPLTPIADLNRRLAELTELCVQSGLSPEIIQPRESTPGRVAPIVPIRFEATGPLADVHALLGRFDRDYPDLHVESISLEQSSPETVRLRTVLSWLTAPAG